MLEEKAPKANFPEIHRDLGRLEGRVTAVESNMNRIEISITNLMNKMEEWQNTGNSQLLEMHSSLFSKMEEMHENQSKTHNILIEHISEENSNKRTNKNWKDSLSFVLNVSVAAALVYVSWKHG